MAGAVPRCWGRLSVPKAWVAGARAVSAGGILLSVVLILLESCPEISALTQTTLFWAFCAADLSIGALFAGEYVVRLAVAARRLRYALSFYGIVDLVAAASIVPGVLQAWSLTRWHYHGFVYFLRMFRVLKLLRYVEEMRLIEAAVVQESRALFVFLAFLAIVLLFLGSALYVAEGGENGFVSIPASVWWATVTLTTVGYGDMTPNTVLGRAIACVVMLTGYSILAVPTIVGVLSSGHFLRERCAAQEASRAPIEAARTRAAAFASLVEDEADARAAGPPGRPEDPLLVPGERQQYPFFVTFQLRPADCDQQGCLQLAGYQHLMDAAVASFYAQQAVWSIHAPRAVAMQGSCEVSELVSFPATLDVGLAVESVRHASCGYCLGFFRQHAAQRCASGRLRHDWTHGVHGPLAPVPAAVREACWRMMSPAAAGSRCPSML